MGDRLFGLAEHHLARDGSQLFARDTGLYQTGS